MDNLSHSLSKKTCNANGFVGKAVYDDVFGGPPKLGLPTLCPRTEDYSEIFGGFHASRPSSIPILDLPAVQEADVAFDVPRSALDYYEVFGGFDGLDFFASYEDLCCKPRDRDESSDEAWTPAQSEYLSDESDHSAYSEENHNFSNGYSHLLSDGSKQSDLSYHMANQKSKEDVSNRMAHITQLHTIPGHSFMVGETSPKIEAKNQPVQVTNGVNHTMDQSTGRREGKQLRKTMSHPSNSSFSTQTFGSNFNPLEGYGKTDSRSNQTFVNVSNISLRTQPSQVPPPSRPPPALAVKQGDSGRRNSKLKPSKSYAFERTAGDSSPPFFDVEVDVSSSAAASVAAMKDAMENAQAKLRTAKELMERKKEGLQSHKKLSFKSDKKHKEQKMCNNFDGLNSFKYEGMQGTCSREHGGMKSLAGAGKQEERKTTQVASNSSEGERHINVANISAEENNGKDYRLSEASYVTKRTGAWKEETEFYELIEANKPQEVFGHAKGACILGHNTQSHGSLQEKRAFMESFVLQETDNRKVKEARDACVEEGEVTYWVPGWNENNKISKATKVSCNCKKSEKNQEASERGENVHILRVAQHADIEIVLTEADNCEEHEKLIEFQWKESDMQTALNLKKANEDVENERRLKNACKREENNKSPKEILEMDKFEKRLKEPVYPAENEDKLKAASEQEEKEKQQMDTRECEENENMQEEAHKRGENDDELKALKQEDNDKILREILEWDEGEKRSKMVLEQEENEKRQKLAFEREEDRMRLMEAPKQEEKEREFKWHLAEEENTQKRKENYQIEENESGIHQAYEREEKEQRLRVALEQKEINKRLQEMEESKKPIKDASNWEQIEKSSDKANELEETESSIKHAGNLEELKAHAKDDDQTEMDENERKEHLTQVERVNFKASSGACKLDDDENLEANQVACKHIKNKGKLEVTEAALSGEEYKLARTEPKYIEGKMEAVDMDSVLVEERINSSGMDHDVTRHAKKQIRADDATESHCSYGNVTKSVEPGVSFGQTDIERNERAPELVFDLNNLSILTHERGERGTCFKEPQVAFDEEENKDKLLPLQLDAELVENGRKMRAVGSSVLERKEIAQEESTRQNIERKENNANENLTPKDRKNEERMMRRKKLEEDQLRKMEEEREREKDRMVVEREVCEAREKAFAEARERAERAAVERAIAEVRQRSMAETRERLEKAGAEARDRSLAEKASMEARLKVRAERAAVERATSEAREPAVGKAMAKKAAHEGQEPIEKLVADNFTPSGDGVRRQTSSSPDLQGLQCQSTGPSSESRYSCSSVHGGVESEPAQRCKARLERHRRTAERAAKALAEKNMRDLLAQRELAERNRLAEGLGAEVKRWSSGKEGNLRALLSTLQYILGPDSGWQPVPLTEVITAAAVKKAYRKATLCVHPDKLQQRGASIQQKYVCEKVFDLLKEAWNKFNSEEP